MEPHACAPCLLRDKDQLASQTQAARAGEKPGTAVGPHRFERCRSADFKSDAPGDGSSFRTLYVIDIYMREVLAVKIDLNPGGKRRVIVPDRVAEVRGLPERISFDNQSEFTGLAVADRAEKNQVGLELIKPGRRMKIVFIERFNRTYRLAILDM